MAKFNTATTKPAVFSPITTERTPSGRSHQGGAGYARDTKSELFLLAVANMVGENTFYEGAGDRDNRYANLVRSAALADPEWTAGFLSWLRGDGNMRSASLVGAAEFVKARLDAGTRPSANGTYTATAPRDGTTPDAVSNRSVVDSVLQRADEPGEFLAYWMSRYGKALPKPVKRGVSDAVWRLYSERSFLKWDSDGRGVRFADVLNLVHPTGSLADTKGKPIADTWRAVLYGHILDSAYGNATEVPASLPTLAHRAELMRLPVERRRGVLDDPQVLARAGITWESLAGWLQGPMDAQAWEAVIPSMGYMALLRNLRNFDQAGVSDEVAARVAAKLADPEEVALSRQLPMRFLSAHRAAPSLRWGWPLEQSLGHALGNVPALGGRTLVLVDTSGSMNSSFSKDGTLMRWDAAAVFGIALGLRCEYADVVSFSGGYYGNDGTKRFPLEKGESLLRAVGRWKTGGYFIGGGTDTVGAIQRHLRPGFHDRLVILTDEQASYGNVGTAVTNTIPLYTWNLAGYKLGHAASGSGNKHTFAGLTDAAFRMIPLLESGRDANWPWMAQASA